MHTLSLFTGSAAIAANNAVLPAIADSIVKVSNNRIVPDTDRQLLAGVAGGLGMSQIFLDSPTLLQNGRPSLYPIKNSAFPGTLLPVVNFGDRGQTLPGREEVAVLTTNTNAGAQQHTAALWHARRFIPAPPGVVKTIQLTTTGALGNLVWSSPLALALTAGLKRGRYKVIGMAAEGANLAFARLILPQQNERPGCVCSVDSTTFQFPNFRNGAMGLYGEFDNDNLPYLEAFGIGVLSGTIIVNLDIIPNPNPPMN